MSASSDEYAVVLAFMHWAMHEPKYKGVKFGELLRIGCVNTDKPYPPPDVEQALLVSAFKLAGVPFSTTMA